MFVQIIDLRDGHLVNDDDELSLDEDEESYVSVIHSIDEIVTFSDTIHGTIMLLLSLCCVTQCRF